MSVQEAPAGELSNNQQVPSPSGFASPAEGSATSAGDLQNDAKASEEISSIADSISARLAEEVAKIISECDDLGTMTMKGLRSEIEQRLGLADGGLDAHRDYVGNLAREQIEARALETPSKSKNVKRHRKSTGLASPPEKKQRTHEAVPKELPAEVTAELLPVTVAGVPVTLRAKTFASGRQGYFATQGIPLTAGGKKFEVHCMVQCAVVDVGFVSEEEEGGEKDADENEDERESKEKNGEDETAMEPSRAVGHVGENSPVEVA
mmetsp:Transcript_131050/g.326951  ORF Transcript_131050/g.326951 Transcript_131050/m.326951 type:complete len:264 (+) Transcript_131050:63-854(+)|eukprot:CAMPEP_0115280120 /NCGR_PEP_ID=MMETSP0270-20121206/58622_1 /TAXON_ID=71861 /ORGANISM="Scrippsiella trochoidea, Strain CCMP3099" /LENGTH=263 /DNA_ID=CAMNT_0002696843 /DNA_START=57 /DNA_END=848 /DNA_ORIENTATION=-